MKGDRPMKAMPIRGIAALAGVSLAISVAGCSSDPADEPDPSDTAASADTYSTREVSDGTTDFVIVENPGDGRQLSYGAEIGTELLEEEVDGLTYAFKDMNANGELDLWEDWRESDADRAAALAQELTIDQISGLMLFSNPQGAPSDGVTEDQTTMLADNGVRNVLISGSGEVEDMAVWANAIQAVAEAQGSDGAPLIPVNIAANPMSEAVASTPVDGDGGVSKWPSLLGLAATGSVETVEEFGRITSAEYRAVGVTNALAPQIDLSTEPRWTRVYSTLGENPELANSMAAAYVHGYQATFDGDGADLGWGLDSVATTIKHFPGDGPGEGGRESHYEAGQYGVYPGGNFSQHVGVFASALDSASVMTSYSISVDGDGEPLFGEEVGSAYDHGKMSVLRDDLGYEGAVVTDWVVLDTPYDEDGTIPGYGTGWGITDLPRDERAYTVLATGGDQFGGIADISIPQAAYDVWVQKHDAGEIEADADSRWRASGERILKPFFLTGLYDSPYVELEDSLSTAGAADAVAAGFQAQLDSVVLTKNDGILSETTASDWADKKVYVPGTEASTFSGPLVPSSYSEGPSLSLEVLSQYFAEVVTDEVELNDEGEVVSFTAPDLADVDVVMVGMRSPSNGVYHTVPGYDYETGEYYPLSLQWGPYTADGDNVRTESISGALLEDGTRENRSYFGNSARIENESDLIAFERALAAIEASGKDIPVVTVVQARNPVVPTEIEPRSNAVLVGFGVSDEALIQVATGQHEPRAKLPLGFPASMDAVEAQLEDVPEDMETYVDTVGNDWTFGYGLDWSGAIG